MPKKNHSIILGLGKTGLACARFLKNKGVDFSVADTRDQPPGFDLFKQEFPHVQCHLGHFTDNQFVDYTELIVSPGIAMDEPWIQAAIQQHVSVIGDVDLLCRATDRPIVAITGSNAKSTVTTLVGEMALLSGVVAGVGGNLGTPAVELLDENNEVYILELSSFQLERIKDLSAEVATILNMTPDHMDRYADYQAYQEAKQNIFNDSRQVVVNRGDDQSAPIVGGAVKLWSFGFDDSSSNEGNPYSFGVIREGSELYLTQGNERIIAASQLKIKGRHNIENALAALAIGSAMGLDRQKMLEALESFSGLPHRCQWVAEIDGVNYVNDSKGTNVGATVAAINGLSGCDQSDNGQIVLIAGGESKGANFEALVSAVKQHVSAVVLIGADAQLIAATLGDAAKILYADTMSNAVCVAQENAKAGDIVLLSPACASFDMFDHFEHRGDIFVHSVEDLSTGVGGQVHDS